MQIGSDQRVALVGKTGSGKTYLAKRLLQTVNRLVVIDSKGTLGRSFNTVNWSSKNVKRLERGENIRIRVPAPIAATTELQTVYDDYFRALYEIGNLTVYIDELFAVTGGRNVLSPYLTALYTRGRELGISVWSCMQRPSRVPIFSLSESDWFFVFMLQSLEDRKRVASYMSEAVINPPPDKHGFYLYNTDQAKLYYTQGIK